ncbi:MAG TPA: HAMP domain-containing sensor histidine kinase [Thermoanaerobaculia bacterium]
MHAAWLRLFPRIFSRIPGLSVEVLLWAAGFFCGFIGGFLLIAPHHFRSDPYQALLPYALAWGTLALTAGLGLLAVAVMRPPRWVSCTFHLLVGLTLLALAASFLRVNAISGTVTYTILGSGILLACRLPRDRPGAPPAGGDLFGLLIGLCATASGILILAAPRLFQRSFYGPFRGFLPVFGLVFLVAGPLLVTAQLNPALGRATVRRIHLFAGMAYLVFGALVSLPGLLWTGVALYWGGGVTVALLPWIRHRLAALDTSALRARLSLALAIATSLALILATAVVTAQEEELAKEQVAATQRIEAQSVAQNVFDYVEMNGARTATLAAFAARASATAEGQEPLLAASMRIYPDIAALRSMDRDGRVTAAAGALALPPPVLQDLAAAVRREGRNQLTPVLAGGRSFLLLGAPIHGDGGDDPIAGALVAAFDARALEHRIARAGSDVSLADGFGRTIAAVNEIRSPDAPLPPLPAGWDLRIRAGKPVARPEAVAEFARVSRLGWIVAVERPRADALAGVRRGRDFAFGLLLLVIPLAVAVGIYASRRIARPLGDLSNAVGGMSTGDLAVPIGASSGISEVARLSASFQEMRERLAERTRESERLAGELRARAEALAETDRRKDEFLAMLAHELRNPLGAIANASYLLEQLATADPRAERPTAIIRRQIQHLVRMVDDLLDVSRITRGKVELRRGPVDLAEVLRHAVETARPLAEAKEQTLRAEIPAGPLPLDGDATRLEQVFSNLLRNAIKFTDAGGLIEVMTEVMAEVTTEVSADRDGPREAVVKVCDDGIGIPADLLPRVFDLFAQGEQGLDRSGAGLGIGLTLVRSLVEMHGGQVEAHSDGPGRGSELVVRLPLAA